MSRIPDPWRGLALDPPRAHGAPVGTARYRCEDADFQVDEQLGFEPAGSGQHVLLRVRKQGANTDWVAREIARLGGCRPMDVGFAGLKDRHAVTTQWMSVPAGRDGPGRWHGLAGNGFEVIEAHAHSRKLPRGALETNHFRLVLRDFSGDAAQLGERLARIGAAGVPNYFGPQRFGRDLSNLRVFAPAADDVGETPRRPQRPGGFELSAGRSLLFNAVLAARVAEHSWDQLEPGELANLDGRGSVFRVDAVDDALRARLAGLDVHPTGPLWGDGAAAVDGRIAALEAGIVAGFPGVTSVLAGARLEPARGSLRLPVRGLRWSLEGDALELAFELRSGGYATTVLREVTDAVEAPRFSAA